MKKTKTILSAVLALMLAACASRSNACDVIEGTRDLEGQVAAPSQTAKTGDRLAGVAVREGGEGDNVQHTADTGVDVQAQNQTSGPQVQFAPLVGDARAAAAALATTTPGEQHVIDSLRESRERKHRLQTQLDATPAAEAAELERLRGELAQIAREETSFVERLEGYAERKYQLAQTLTPNLASLTHVVQLVMNPQAAGSAEFPLISDEQARAIASVAGEAVKHSTDVESGGE